MQEIKNITENKKQYIDLLFLTDEDEQMIDKYLDKGEFFAQYDNGEVRSICVVTNEGDNIYEIKNMATDPNFHRMGYARQLINYVANYYKSKNAKRLLVGTGRYTSTVEFYEKCGFTESHIIKNFFTDNYSHIMIDNGVQLVDMIYLKQNL